MIKNLIDLAEQGILPDFLIRSGIRRMQKERILWSKSKTVSEVEKHHQNWVDEMKKSSIAYVPEKANSQHYEVPPAFFENALGAHLKYSSGYWPEGISTLDDSELAMLELSAERAEISNGDQILELGCGWGSLTMYMAKKYPDSSITAVSNSKDQRKFIENKCKERSINNVKVITKDMNDFTIEEKFDRIVSIEMFEHMRNYEQLLDKVASWLKPDGKLFIHIFTHKTLVYPFTEDGEGDWMGRNFFSGGIMPSHQLLLYFQNKLNIEKSWRFNGSHYEQTSLAWLKKMDSNKKEIMSIFENTYGKEDAKIWFQRWRIFFMACEVLFGYDGGREWGVSHYRFVKSGK